MWRAPTPQRLVVYRLTLPPEGQQQAILAATEDLLTAADRARLQRFRVPSAAAEFHFGRLLLRAALSALLPPGRRQVRIDPLGKPQLVGDDFCFNLSHSGGTILLALATEPVGVDIQYPDPHLEPGIAMIMATASEQAWVRSPDQFYDLWVRKEAVLKCLGTGFYRDPATVELGHQLTVTLPAPNSTLWMIQMQRFTLPPAYGAVAWQQRSDRPVPAVEMQTVDPLSLASTGDRGFSKLNVHDPG
jgi:phosphopantetheinyl transferase